MSYKELTRKDYLERINKILIFINDHLDENLELENLAKLSNFSSYHFHRIVRAHLREPLGNYIQRVRLDKAASLIMFTKEPINDIASKVGYESHASFTKAFKKRFDVSPSDVREDIGLVRITTDFVKLNKFENVMEIKPKIKKIDSKKVIFLNTIGPYKGDGIGKSWETLCEFAQKKKLFGFNTEFIGISYDDPHVTEADKLRYDACVTVRKTVEPEGEIGFKEIQGGNFAIFRHIGSYEKFEQTYDYIFRQWLPESGMELRDSPCLEKYIDDPEKIKPEKLRTDIYIPIA